VAKPPSQGAVIEAEGLTKVYGESVKTHALRGVDFHVERAEFLSIIGQSGSGKSTLLNILGLLDRPTEGTVRLLGTDVVSLNSAERAAFRNEHIGFVFQFHHLLPEFSVRENLLMPTWIAGGAHKDGDSRSKEILAFLGLEAVADKGANELSGGQKQRVAIARALMNSPEIVLADEPTGNLDTVNTAQVYGLFRRLHEEWDTTFVIVTHDRSIAQQTDRIVEVRDGLVEQDVPNTYARAGKAAVA
jgi:lipoprotein-releasing system ATP-binding protein